MVTVRACRTHKQIINRAARCGCGSCICYVTAGFCLTPLTLMSSLELVLQFTLK